LNLPTIAEVSESQIGTQAQLVLIAARMRRFFLRGTFGEAALRDIGDCVVWNSLAISGALSSWCVVEGPLAREIACGREDWRICPCGLLK
jgi:hypothetical protein